MLERIDDRSPTFGELAVAAVDLGKVVGGKE
jgi:hypothetical protein